MKTVKPRIASKLYGKIVQVIEYKKMKHRTSTAERIQVPPEPGDGARDRTVERGAGQPGRDPVRPARLLPRLAALSRVLDPLPHSGMAEFWIEFTSFWNNTFKLGRFLKVFSS